MIVSRVVIKLYKQRRRCVSSDDMASNVTSDLKTCDMAYLRKLQASIQQEIASRTPKKYTSILNEICQRHSRYFHVTYAYVPNRVICRFVIHYDNVTCTYDASATGTRRRDAKENASTLIYNMICNNVYYKQITDNAHVDASRIAHAEHQLDVELGCDKRPLGCDKQKNYSSHASNAKLDDELDFIQENIAKYHDTAASSLPTVPTTFATFAKQQLDDELDSIQENIAKHHTAVEFPQQEENVYSDSESINISDNDDSSTDTTDDGGFTEIM